MKPRYGVLRDNRIKSGKYEKMTCKQCGFTTVNLSRVCTGCLNEGKYHLARLQLKEQQRCEKISAASIKRHQEGTLGKHHNGPNPKLRKVSMVDAKRVMEVYLKLKEERIRGPVRETAQVTGFSVNQVTHMIGYYKKEMEQANNANSEER